MESWKSNPPTRQDLTTASANISTLSHFLKNSHLQEIVELKTKLNNVNQKIKDMEKTLTDFKEAQEVQNKELNASVDKLKETIFGLPVEVEYQKYIRAFQAINRFHSLESQVPNFNRLRGNWVDLFHFIDDDDLPAVKEYKMCHTLTQIPKMSPACQAIFAKRYGSDFLTNFTNAVNKIELSGGDVSDEDKADAHEWWERWFY